MNARPLSRTEKVWMARVSKRPIRAPEYQHKALARLVNRGLVRKVTDEEGNPFIERVAPPA